MPSADWRRFTLKKGHPVARSRKEYPPLSSTSTEQVNNTTQYLSASRNYDLEVEAPRGRPYMRQMSVDSRPSTSQAEFRDVSFPTSPRSDFAGDYSDAAGEPLAHDFAADLIPGYAKPLVSTYVTKRPVGEKSVTSRVTRATSVDSLRRSPGMTRGWGVSVTSKGLGRLPLPKSSSYGSYIRHLHRPLMVASYEPTATSSAATTPREARSADSIVSHESNETAASSVHTLPPLQAKSGTEDSDGLEPILEDDPGSYDLVSGPLKSDTRTFSLEQRSEQMFSREHLEEIFADPSTMLEFTSFLSSRRPDSMPLLIYYLDALKALKAIKYANAIAEALTPIDDHEFTGTSVQSTANVALENRTKEAFDALVRDELPAYIAHVFIQVVSLSIQRRVTGTLPSHLREASEGLAEVFCLTDPSRPDNPIVFASEEFHRTTQYGVDYAIGRNCRFLQGPQTNKDSTRRLREAILAGKEVSEVFLN
jgi:hypothetical protein